MSVLFAFGYDSNSNDYKLLAGGVLFDGVFEVFSFKSNSWRSIENVPYDSYISKQAGVLVNGERHWLVRRKVKQVHEDSPFSKYSPDVILVSLDISNEIFKEMELPKELLDEIEQRIKELGYCGLEFRNLGVVEGCLCLLVVVDFEDCVDVWVMQNYGVRESWTKRYTVHIGGNKKGYTFLGADKLRLLWSFKSGEVLFVSAADDSLFLYFPGEGKVLHPNIYSLIMLREEECYFESLVSLKSGTYVGEEKQIEDSGVSSASKGETLILRGTLVGHSDMITAIACPIGNSDMILSSSCDKSILVWTLNKQEGSYGVPKRRLTGHGHSVQDVVLSSDAKFALSGSLDGELRLWDLNTGVTTRRFVGHTKDVLSVAFSTDNNLIVSASRDRSIKVWNTQGECKYTIQDGTEGVSCVRFIPETSYPTIASASWDKTVKIWNLTNCKLRNTFSGHGGYVNTVAVSPDGTICASGGNDGVILIWDLAEGKKLYSSLAGGIIHALCFCPNRYWLCSATEACVKILDLESKCVVQELKAEPDPGKNKTFYCSSMDWSSNGSTLFTGYTDGVIRVWGF